MSVNTPTDISLKNFFIFHTKYGQKEGEEEEKIIFFYPADSSIDYKMKEVGLSEAIIKFIENFSSSPCEELQTEKAKKFFYQPEEDIWMVMTLNIPYGPRGKDVLEGMEPLEYKVKSPVFKAVLKQAYLNSRLILGPYQTILDQSNGVLTDLKTKISRFFTKYLENLKLKDCGIVDLFQGVEYCGLDKPAFLLAQSIVNQVEGKFLIFDYSLLLYKEKIVWSGLAPEDAQILYRYLVGCLIPTFLSKSNRPLSSNVTLPPSMRFVVGCHGKERKVFLTKVDKPGFYNLIVYRVNQATICLLSDSSAPIKEELFGKLDEFLRDRMNNLCKEILDSESQKSQTAELADSPCTRFVYFNSTNLANKTTLFERRLGQPTVCKDSLRLLVDIHEHHHDLQEQGCKSGETLYKSLSDYWVMGMMSNGREFFVTVDKKKLSLLDVSEEVKNIGDKQLKGIFFQL